MKTIISVILALVVGYFAISIFYFVMGSIYWLAFELMKIVLVLLFAIPAYIIIRRKLLR